jgi:hypothetical protein
MRSSGTRPRDGASTTCHSLAREPIDARVRPSRQIRLERQVAYKRPVVLECDFGELAPPQVSGSATRLLLPFRLSKGKETLKGESVLGDRDPLLLLIGKDVANQDATEPKLPPHGPRAGAEAAALYISSPPGCPDARGMSGRAVQPSTAQTQIVPTISPVFADSPCHRKLGLPEKAGASGTVWRTVGLPKPRRASDNQVTTTPGSTRRGETHSDTDISPACGNSTQFDDIG